ncbi:TIM17 [Sanghuangporus sanghuang]
MANADHTRDPCPWVILSDFGGAFAMGAIGGGIWHGIKGARNSPRGERLVGAVSVIKARAPVTGGNFGVWGGMFSTFDCAVKGYRQKEDAWNAIISGFLTGGCLAARSGPRSALGSAVACTKATDNSSHHCPKTCRQAHRMYNIILLRIALDRTPFRSLYYSSCIISFLSIPTPLHNRPLVCDLLECVRPSSADWLADEARSSPCLRRTLQPPKLGRIRRQQSTYRGVSTSTKTCTAANGGFSNDKRFELEDQHALRRARSVLLCASRLQRKEARDHGLVLESLVEACDALSASQVERNVRITVYGEEKMSAQNLITVLLDDPLSSDPSLRSELQRRVSQDAQTTVLRFQQTGAQSDREESVKLASPFFTRFSVPVVLQELRSSSDTIRHLLQSDVPILVVSPLNSPHPPLLSALSSNLHTFLVVDGALDPSSPSSETFRSQIAVQYGVDQNRVFLVDSARALRGVSALSADPSSASAVRAFQDDMLASGIPNFSHALSDTVSQYGAERLRTDTENAVTKRAIATVKDVILQANEEAREVRSRSSALQEEALEARERAEVEILGGDADVAVQGEQGRVARGIEKVKSDLRPVLDGLTWYRLPFVVDDVSVRVDRAVEHAFAREFENELIFHTGRLASLQAHFVSRTTSLLTSLPHVFHSSILQNTLAQITSSPSFLITPSSPSPDSSSAFTSNSTPSPPALLTPLRTRTAQLAYATRSLHLSAQRLLLFTFANTSLSSLSSALLYVHFSIDASTSIAFGMLGTLAGLRWAVGRWTKARERWFAAFGRVGEGLERDMNKVLGGVLDRQVCVVPNEACKGSHSLVERREKEIGEVEDEVEELESSLEAPEQDESPVLNGGKPEGTE